MDGSKSSNDISGCALNELMNLSGESEVPKFMKYFFFQQMAELKAFANMFRDQAAHARSCLENLDVMIYEMRKVRTVAGNDSLDCLKESHQIKSNKLKALTNLIAETDDSVFSLCYLFRKSVTMTRNTVKRLMKPLDKPEREFRRLRRAALRSHQNESLAIAERNLFDEDASSSNNIPEELLTHTISG
ncbi:hypothetical protein Tco_0453276 [Tanacetum coccineum]